MGLWRYPIQNGGQGHDFVVFPVNQTGRSGELCGRPTVLRDAQSNENYSAKLGLLPCHRVRWPVMGDVGGHHAPKGKAPHPALSLNIRKFIE